MPCIGATSRSFAKRSLRLLDGCVVVSFMSSRVCMLSRNLLVCHAKEFEESRFCTCSFDSIDQSLNFSNSFDEPQTSAVSNVKQLVDCKMAHAAITPSARLFAQRSAARSDGWSSIFGQPGEQLTPGHKSTTTFVAPPNWKACRACAVLTPLILMSQNPLPSVTQCE